MPAVNHVTVGAHLLSDVQGFQGTADPRGLCLIASPSRGSSQASTLLRYRDSGRGRPTASSVSFEIPLLEAVLQCDRAKQQQSTKEGSNPDTPGPASPSSLAYANGALFSIQLPPENSSITPRKLPTTHPQGSRTSSKQSKDPNPGHYPRLIRFSQPE